MGLTGSPCPPCPPLPPPPPHLPFSYLPSVPIVLPHLPPHTTTPHLLCLPPCPFLCPCLPHPHCHPTCLHRYPIYPDLPSAPLPPPAPWYPTPPLPCHSPPHLYPTQTCMPATPCTHTHLPFDIWFSLPAVFAPCSMACVLAFACAAAVHDADLPRYAAAFVCCLLPTCLRGGARARLFCRQPSPYATSGTVSFVTCLCALPARQTNFNYDHMPPRIFPSTYASPPARILLWRQYHPLPSAVLSSTTTMLCYPPAATSAFCLVLGSPSAHAVPAFMYNFCLDSTHAPPAVRRFFGYANAVTLATACRRCSPYMPPFYYRARYFPLPAVPALPFCGTTYMALQRY